MISIHDVHLNGEVAVVTGGANGIGRGIAEGLSIFGADVIIVDIDVQAGKFLAEQLSKNGENAHFLHADLMDTAIIPDVIERASRLYRRVNILVNNVGGVRQKPFAEMTERSRNRHIQLNLESVFATTQAVTEIMIQQDSGGSILNISSIEGSRAAPNYAVYAACKAALNNFTQTMALELSRHSIRVNAISPDIVVTDGAISISPDFISDEVKQRRNAYIPLQRDGTPDDIARAAVFLSSKMASYITGAILPVDGGTSASSGWRRTGNDRWDLY